MPLSFDKAASELDAVYIRAKERYEADPDAFETEQPLLARAFDEAKPGPDLANAMKVWDRRVKELEAQIRKERIEFETTIEASRALARGLRREIQDSEHRAWVLTEEVQKRDLQIQDLTRTTQYTGSEQERLANLGWKKEIA